MGTITTGVGLISGLNIQDIVTQLMKIERRPVDLLQKRIVKATEQQTAYTELTARVTAWKSAVSRLALPSSFTVKRATSTNESVLRAAAAPRTAAGTYTFQVRSLVSTHQVVSQGFADRNQTPVGAGVLNLRVGGGRVDQPTLLADLNGGAGVRRGLIRISDRSGASATVDLRAVQTVADVLEAINGQTAVNVRAYTSGDRIIVADETGLTTGTLSISDLAGGFTARDLGIAGSDGDDGTIDGRIIGRDVIDLTVGTRLNLLNDGAGVPFDRDRADFAVELKDGSVLTINLGRLRLKTAGSSYDDSTHLMELNDGRGVSTASATVRITNRRGESAEIDLSGMSTLHQVVEAINGATVSGGGPLGVSVLVSGNALFISDSTGGTAADLKVEDVSGTAARDLGISGQSATGSFKGSAIYRFDTVGAVQRAIQYARDASGAVNDPGRLEVRLENNALVLVDHTVGSGVPRVTAINGPAAGRLGLTAAFHGDTLRTRDLVAGLNTVLLSSLAGGRGVSTGAVRFTLRDGTTQVVDFTGDQTLQDVIGRINAVPGLSAQTGPGGTGLVVRDVTTGSGPLIVEDLGGGGMAAGLAIAGTFAGGVAAGGDLQLRVIHENTLLSSLNGGRGVALSNGPASFGISTSDGRNVTVTLRDTVHRTVGDVIDEINLALKSLGASPGVVARLNDTGDGIAIVDDRGGAARLTVMDLGGGTAAADLRIAGTAGTDNVIRGRHTAVIETDTDDTLDDLVSKINAAGLPVFASVINDGTTSAPHRLVLTSRISGKAGELAFSGGIPGLDLNVLTEARDATLIVGGAGGSGPIVVTSSSNTVRDVVDGLTLTLVAPGSAPVDVAVSADIESVVTDVKSFASSFNDIIDRIRELTRYVPATQTSGVLLGENAVLQLYNQLYGEVNREVGDTSLRYRRLSDVGISVTTGSRLTVNEERLRRAFEEDPESVRKLFSYVRVDRAADGTEKPVPVGVAARLKKYLDAVTSTVGGLLPGQSRRLQDRIDGFKERIGELEELLKRKEQRLYNQFYAMEQALAQMQDQQSSLQTLAGLASQAATNTRSSGR